jgi:hypothetical protein
MALETVVVLVVQSTSVELVLEVARLDDVGLVRVVVVVSVRVGRVRVASGEGRRRRGVRVGSEAAAGRRSRREPV